MGSRKRVSGPARIALSALASVALIGALATSASADITETGNRICTGSTPVPMVKFKYKGDTYVKAPGSSTTVTYYHSGSNWYTGTRQGAGAGGAWSVRAETDLDTGYTSS